MTEQQEQALRELLVGMGHQPHFINQFVREAQENREHAVELERYAGEIMGLESKFQIWALLRALVIACRRAWEDEPALLKLQRTAVLGRALIAAIMDQEEPV
jgi:hypothetical protein